MAVQREACYKLPAGFDATAWQGLAGPAGMPPEVVARLNDAFNKVMAMPAERAYAETTASQIDREVHDLAERAFNRAVELLTERRALLDATAHTLLEAETLDAAAIDAIAEGLKNAA